MTPIAGTFEIARRLQRDTAIATLTNNGSLLKESIAEILPAAAELFGSAFHASFEFGARKPEPQVFTRMAEHCAVPPARILFVDDDAASIAGARSAGLQARLFRSPEDLAAQLRAFGLL
jgi:putative hydrolase of the HAD superfamily